MMTIDKTKQYDDSLTERAIIERAENYCRDRNIKIVYGDQAELFATFAQQETDALAAELKELREFVGAMHNCVLADGAFCCEVDDGVWHLTDVHDDLLASGTDPFDAWRKMNAGEVE